MELLRKMSVSRVVISKISFGSDVTSQPVIVLQHAVVHFRLRHCRNCCWCYDRRAVEGPRSNCTWQMKWMKRWSGTHRLVRLRVEAAEGCRAKNADWEILASAMDLGRGEKKILAARVGQQKARLHKALQWGLQTSNAR